MKKLKDLGLVEETDIENAQDVTIEEFSVKNHVYEGQVQTDDRTHELSVDMTSGEMFCDCERFNLGKKICKHMISLLQRVTSENLDDLDHILKTIKDNGRFKPRYGDDAKHYISTDCEAIDKVFGEGIPKQTISSVFGDWNTGKSIMAHQIAGRVWSEEGKETLYIDTEQQFVGLGGEEYQQWFRDRFNIPDFQIDYRFHHRIKDLMDVFGWDLELEYSDSGKMDSIIRPGGENKIRQEFEDNNYGLLVVDSITEPIDGLMGSGSSSFPGRYPIQKRLLKQIRSIAVDYDVPTFVTMHLSKAPRQYAKPTPKGGKGTGYSVKYILYMKGGTKIGKRKMERHRAIGLPPKKKFKCKLKKDTGFVDL